MGKSHINFKIPYLKLVIFSAPEGHSSSVFYFIGKLVFLWVGGVFPENPVRSQNNDSLYRTIFQRDSNGSGMKVDATKLQDEVF